MSSTELVILLGPSSNVKYAMLFPFDVVVLDSAVLFSLTLFVCVLFSFVLFSVGFAWVSVVFVVFLLLSIVAGVLFVSDFVVFVVFCTSCCDVLAIVCEVLIVSFLASRLFQENAIWTNIKIKEIIKTNMGNSDNFIFAVCVFFALYR